MGERRHRTLRRGAAPLLAVAMLSGVFATAATDAAAAPSPALRRYPYLTDLVGGNVTVNWSTDRSGETGKVDYGPSPACTGATQAASATAITVGAAGGATAQYQWKAVISGLTADTTYCYRVSLGSRDLLGSDPSPRFTSQAAAGSPAPYSFAVFGDWGQVDANGDNADQANVMRQVAKSGVRFAVTTGDTGYPNGSQTTYGDLYLRGADTSAVFGPAFWASAGARIPLFNTTGNHGFNAVGLLNFPQDRAVATSAGQYGMQTYCCTNGTAQESYPNAWYAFDAGQARFYVLTAAWSSTNVGTANPYQNDHDNHWTASSAQYQWLKNDLAAHPGGLKFAFFHYPLYSDNSTESSSTPLRGPGSLEGLLGSNGVQLAFNGHAHLYQRNRPTSDGMVTYLTGGGGATVQPIGVAGCSAIDAYGIGWSNSTGRGSRCGSATAPASRSQVFHFLKVTVAGHRVTVTPIDSLGNTFDVQTYDFGGTASASRFYSATGPARLLDTRPGESPNVLRDVPRTRIGPDEPLEVQVNDLPGATPATGVAAVSLNVTATAASSAGFVTVYPCGQRPFVSNVNYEPGDTVANAVLTPVSTTGTICIHASAPVHVIVDINGWFAAKAGFAAVGPARVADTRADQSPAALRPVAKEPIGGTRELELAVAGLPGVTPGAGVAAVSLNVTAVGAQADGFLTVYPCGSRPFASNVNYRAGAAVPNATITPVSATGTVCVYSNIVTDVVIDINGWFGVQPGFAPAGPARVLDTRAAESPNALLQAPKQPVGGANVLQVQIAGLPAVTPATGVGAVSLNLTVTDPVAPGFLTVYPCGPRALVSNINYSTGDTVANAVITPVSTNGSICIFSSADADVVVDINGWFAGPGQA